MFAVQQKNIIFASTISATPLYNAYQGGTYFYIHMITYTKQPISIADQIAMLKTGDFCLKSELQLYLNNNEKNLFGMYLLSVDFAYRLMGKTNH